MTKNQNQWYKNSGYIGLLQLLLLGTTAGVPQDPNLVAFAQLRAGQVSGQQQLAEIVEQLKKLAEKVNQLTPSPQTQGQTIGSELTQQLEAIAQGQAKLTTAIATITATMQNLPKQPLTLAQVTAEIQKLSNQSLTLAQVTEAIKTSRESGQAEKTKRRQEMIDQHTTLREQMMRKLEAILTAQQQQQTALSGLEQKVGAILTAQQQSALPGLAQKVGEILTTQQELARKLDSKATPATSSKTDQPMQDLKAAIARIEAQFGEISGIKAQLTAMMATQTGTGQTQSGAGAGSLNRAGSQSSIGSIPGRQSQGGNPQGGSGRSRSSSEGSFVFVDPQPGTPMAARDGIAGTDQPGAEPIRRTSSNGSGGPMSSQGPRWPLWPEQKQHDGDIDPPVESGEPIARAGSKDPVKSGEPIARAGSKDPVKSGEPITRAGSKDFEGPVRAI